MHKQIWVMAVIAAPFLAGCAGIMPRDEISYNAVPAEPGLARVEDKDQKPLECVPFARDHSGVKIFGDAYTWWDKAADKYQRAAAPQMGAVMVLSNYAGPYRGHVAVVGRIVSPREIRVDHANWLDDGSVYLNDPVADVSPGNDWSQVRVFNIKTGAWGGHTYPVQGFILSPNQPPLSQQPAPQELPDPTPQDRDIGPESFTDPGPIALVETPQKAR